MSSTTVQPPIFREYIGARSSVLTDFPYDKINRNVEFHFILAFATEDYDTTTRKGTGNFNARWGQLAFNAEKIKNLKRKYENVKVIISIGGRGNQYPFNTQESSMWLHNAQKTLRKIIDAFSAGIDLIDGIDVNYESIESGCEDAFVDSIGKLLRSLKEDKNLAIKVVSIAPSESVQAHYKELYRIYGRNGDKQIIDWVDYQFYNQINNITTLEDFAQLYRELLNHYPHKNLLAGFSTDPNGPVKIKQQVFLDGCRHLLTKKLLPGIFVWDAEGSWNNNFQFEEIAQNLLLSQTRQD